MVSSSLFATPPEINPEDFLGTTEASKTADQRMTSPPSHWSDEVTQQLLQLHPYIPADRILVNFKNMDETNGTAFGYVGISDAPRISIPVIITNRRLKPMDIMIVRNDHDTDNEEAVGNMEDDTVGPLTEESFEQALDSGEPGQLTHPTDIRGTGWTEHGTALRLPYRGRTAVASVMGADETKKAELGEILKTAKDVTAGFGLHCPEVVESWLNAPDPSMLFQSKIASRNIEPAVVKVAGDLPDEVNTADFLAAEIFQNSGEVKTAVALDAISLANPTEVNRYLVFDDGHHCLAPAKVAVAASGRSEDDLVNGLLQKIASRGLQKGDTVCFHLEDNFTAPAKIASIQLNEEAGTITMSMFTGLNQYPVVLSSQVKTAMLSDQGVWVIPLTNNVLKLASSADENAMPMPIEKVATHLLNQVPDQLICAGGAYTLMIEGEPFGADRVSEAKCAAVLNQFFANGADLLDMAKQAAADNGGTGHVRFDSNLREVMNEIAKEASYFNEYPEVARNFIETVSLPMADAAKLAAALSDPRGADAVLGTGFLTEDNLAEFAGLSDDFKEIVGKLARLLLLIRMGYPEGDESATLVAMKALQRVSEGLQSMTSSVQMEG